MKRRYVILLISAALVVFVGIWLIVDTSKSRKKDVGVISQKEVQVSYPRLVYNPNDLREVAGFFDHIYVGKVINEIGTVNNDGEVSTQYRVEIIKSIKGDLDGIVTVSQWGGLSNGVWQLYESDTRYNDGEKTNLIDGYFLVPDRIYLLASRTSSERGWEIVGIDKAARGLLNIVASKNGSVENAAIDDDDNVNAMKEAIENQIVPEAVQKARDRAKQLETTAAPDTN